MIPTRINGRWTLNLPAHRAARDCWPWWEAARLAAMHHHLGPGDVVYDIGAEEGDLPALWASWGCDVVLVEPNPRVWPNIKAIFEANDLTGQLRASWAGFAADVSDGVAPAGCGDWPPCADGPLIGDHGFLNLCERPDVGRLAIDDAPGFLGCPPPTAITIDVEGAELFVLRGAERTLREHRPKVWVSIHPTFLEDMYGVADGVDVIRGHMADRGYEATFLATDHEVHFQFLPEESV